jgi:Ca2+-transporting ATPase
MVVFGYLADSSEMVYYSKGSVESILNICKTYDNGGPTPLDGEVIDKIHRAHDKMTKEGLRVLACARGSKCKDMMFLGLVGIHDIPRPNIQQHLKLLMGMGIQVVMITGDSG